MPDTSLRNLPPEPPPPQSESDYGGSGRNRRNLGAILDQQSDTTDLLDIEVPIPNHLLQREATPELNAAVAKVLADAHDPIPKAGYNKFHNYAYATIDDLRQYIRKALGANDLSYEQHLAGISRIGKIIIAHYYFVLVHKSGQTAPPQRVSALASLMTEKGSLDDKVLSKTSSLAWKDWVKSRFSINTGDLQDDPDAAPPDTQQPPPEPPATRRPTLAPVPSQPPPEPPVDTTLSPAGGTHAFRTAGLPPKVVDRPEPPHDPITGELTERPPARPANGPGPARAPDPWTYGALQRLEEQRSYERWLEELEKIYAELPSPTAVQYIENSQHYKGAMPQTLAVDKTKIANWHHAAMQRFAKQMIPDEPG